MARVGLRVSSPCAKIQTGGTSSPQHGHILCIYCVHIFFSAFSTGGTCLSPPPSLRLQYAREACVCITQSACHALFILPASAPPARTSLIRNSEPVLSLVRCIRLEPAVRPPMLAGVHPVLPFLRFDYLLAAHRVGWKWFSPMRRSPIGTMHRPSFPPNLLRNEWMYRVQSAQREYRGIILSNSLITQCRYLRENAPAFRFYRISRETSCAVDAALRSARNTKSVNRAVLTSLLIRDIVLGHASGPRSLSVCESNMRERGNRVGNGGRTGTERLEVPSLAQKSKLAEVLAVPAARMALRALSVHIIENA